MDRVILPNNEQERLAALRKYEILDTPPEAEYDDITGIAAALCNTPVSLISIIDEKRQWLKSHYGLEGTETAREHSLCMHAIGSPGDILVVRDLRKDQRFSPNPFVTGEPHIVFYAGIPLVDADGYALGALCVLDYKPRTLNAVQISQLRSLGRQVVALLELKRRNKELRRKRKELSHVYGDLEKLSRIASHDLKSPLNNIISLTHLLMEDYSTKLDAEGNEYIVFLNEAAYRLSDMVSGILSYFRASKIVVSEQEQVGFTALVAEVLSLLNIPGTITVQYEKDDRQLYSSRPALKEILLQLVHNAIKYCDKTNGQIAIKLYEDKASFSFEVKDNGGGIAEQNKEKIFHLFERLDNKIKDGESMGIGLAIVKRLVEKAGGEIKVVSDIGRGTSFIVTIPK